MGINETPKGNRIHIGLFGRRNAGKSSLINALTGQDMAIVSHTPGTTTDPVSKAMELHPIGPVVFTDTAGFDDEGELGMQRTDRTRKAIEATDIAIIVIDGIELAAAMAAMAASGAADPASRPSPGEREDPERLKNNKAAGVEKDPLEKLLKEEKEWIENLRGRKRPVITVINKWDAVDESERDPVYATACELLADLPGLEETAIISVSAMTGDGIDELRRAIADAATGVESEEESLVSGIEEGSLVLLVMPQDIQAPKGRLILPQVQTIRALLDRKCSVVSTTADGFSRSLGELARDPDLIITDSQCFAQVSAEMPPGTPLTSFSILMAKAKGDIDAFMAGAKAIDDLVRKAERAGCGHEDPDAVTRASGSDGDRIRILIAEACTHVPQNEDIGTVKIPRMLSDLFGDAAEITNVRGNDFPEPDDLRDYDLIIHCGACMFNRRHVMSRIAAAEEAGVPITNYGVFLAKMAGILEQVKINSEE